jgi:hypothetical protein
MLTGELTFQAWDGETLTGEVWCPGPVQNSVWVLLPDGSSRAVQLPAARAKEVTRGPAKMPWTPSYGHLTLTNQQERLACKGDRVTPPSGASMAVEILTTLAKVAPTAAARAQAKRSAAILRSADREFAAQDRMYSALELRDEAAKKLRKAPTPGAQGHQRAVALAAKAERAVQSARQLRWDNLG